MPRSQKIYKKKKIDVSKRWSKSESSKEPMPGPSRDSETTPTSNRKSRTVNSSSKTKLGDTENIYKYYENDFEYCILDLKVLESILQTAAVCRNCKKGTLTLQQNNNAGLACKIQIYCAVCDVVSETNNSKYVTDADNIKYYDINLRLVYGMRSIGKGKAAADMLCGVMNLPQPPFYYYKHENFLGTAAMKICKASMSKAIEEEVEINEGSRDLAVAVDGSWQKRGHTSLNGIVSATSICTGKVLDIEVLSKYCRCLNKSSNVHDVDCCANFSGTSGGMEVAGAKAIFNRSLEQYGVRYLKYLGDGDSRAYKAVVESKPYGSTDIEKIECIGHMQKRMGTRLRALRNSKPTLEDGKPLIGKHRLTLEAVGNLQLYYGLAIRRNCHSVEEMKKAIWASYFHVSADDKSTEKHMLCPQDQATSWCKFVQAKAENKPYKHAEHFHLPETVMNHIKKLYQDLSNPTLLQKCLAGKTQNPNESLNNCVWSIVPKTNFVALRTLRFGVFEAVSVFNEGNRIKCEMLKELGLEPGKNLARSMKNRDQRRIAKSEKYVDEIQKKMRRKTELLRKRLEDRYEEEEGVDNPAYASGQY